MSSFLLKCNLQYTCKLWNTHILSLQCNAFWQRHIPLNPHPYQQKDISISQKAPWCPFFFFKEIQSIKWATFLWSSNLFVTFAMRLCAWGESLRWAHWLIWCFEYQEGRFCTLLVPSTSNTWIHKDNRYHYAWIIWLPSPFWPLKYVMHQTVIFI